MKRIKINIYPSSTPALKILSSSLYIYIYISIQKKLLYQQLSLSILAKLTNYSTIRQQRELNLQVFTLSAFSAPPQYIVRADPSPSLHSLARWAGARSTEIQRKWRERPWGRGREREDWKLRVQSRENRWILAKGHHHPRRRLLFFHRPLSLAKTPLIER